MRMSITSVQNKAAVMTPRRSRLAFAASRLGTLAAALRALAAGATLAGGPPEPPGASMRLAATAGPPFDAGRVAAPSDFDRSSHPG